MSIPHVLVGLCSDIYRMLVIVSVYSIIGKKTQNTNWDYFFIIASQGGETSITWGRIVQGAKRLGGETSRGRTDEGAKRP